MYKNMNVLQLFTPSCCQTQDPVRSPLNKPVVARSVVGSVTSESLVLSALFWRLKVSHSVRVLRGSFRPLQRRPSGAGAPLWGTGRLTRTRWWMWWLLLCVCMCVGGKGSGGPSGERWRVGRTGQPTTGRPWRCGWDARELGRCHTPRPQFRSDQGCQPLTRI